MPEISKISEKISNYDITRLNVQKTFCEYDHKKTADRFDLPLDDEYLFINFFCRKYRINRKTGVTTWSDDNFETENEADFNEVLSIFDLLFYSKENAVCSGEYVLLHQLSKVQTGNSYAGKGMFEKYEKAFDNKDDLLENACRSLNGEPFGKGDVSYRLSIFKDFSVVLSFWNSDEDFPAQMQLFFDKNALDFMHYETLWYVACLVIYRILDYVEKS